MNKTRTQWFGLLGVLSFLSYFTAVVFSPLAYPTYNWRSQAVSDLSATHAPSLELWNQLSALHVPCALVCCSIACIVIQNESRRLIRRGIVLFTVMNWISGIGYNLFPLTEGGLSTQFQNQMHVVVTIFVVLLSVLSLSLLVVAGIKEKKATLLTVGAGIALFFMMVGSVGVGIVPADYFGVAERCSVLSATGYVGVIGIYLFINEQSKQQHN